MVRLGRQTHSVCAKNEGSPNLHFVLILDACSTQNCHAELRCMSFENRVYLYILVRINTVFHLTHECIFKTMQLD